MGKIVLTLKSDLCASSGQAFSNIVDSDIVTDSFGLPYIPARRIKGCLRDAAEYIESSIIDKLFGESGKSDSGLLKIGNGYLKDREALESVLAARKDFPPQRVTELFTDIKAQTAIERDTAKDNSLRFTRTLSHYLPYSREEETSFVFNISGVAEEYRQEFENICKALRHIGLMRTRGLGFVSARYEHEADNNPNTIPNTFERNGCYYLPLHIELTEPLLIATQDNTECLEYVPGTAVLGAFARLAVLSGMNDEEFSDIFLSGKVRFNNLYISDEGGTRTIPAPHFMRKLKSTDPERDGRIVTEFDKPENGIDTPKLLKEKTVSASEFTRVIDVSTETQYHHSRGNDSILYTQDSISAGQYLYGEVESEDSTLLDKLVELLKTGDFRLGRSKTAQYSGCRVLGYAPVEKRHDRPSSGKTIFALESDIILFDDSGVNTVDPEELRKALNIPKETEVKFDLGFKLIHGYNAKRNMRNLPVAAFAMGSTVAVMGSVSEQTELLVGSRLSEGFGRVKCYSEKDILFVEKDGSLQKEPSTSALDSEPRIRFNAYLDKEVERAFAIEKAMEIFENNIDFFKRSVLNAAFVGSVSRMVETAESPKQAFDRIGNIKDTAKKETIDAILKKIAEDLPDDVRLECMLMVLGLAKYRLKLEKKEGGANE